MTDMTRRDLLETAAATAGVIAGAPAVGRARSKEPIRTGALCPLIKQSGGIHGRSIQIIPEENRHAHGQG